MSKYIINTVFLLFFFLTYAQQSNMAVKSDTLTVINDTIVHSRQPVKIRLGFDVGKYFWARLNNSTSYDVYVDANFYKNYYLILQAGSENHLTETTLLNYTTEGTYFKIGVDYNLYENWLDMDNDISIGFRYGHSLFDYQLHSYRVNQPGSIFVPLENQVNTRFENLSASWIDITTKIQVETIHNLYLGYALSLKYLLNYSQPDNFEVSYIPGFFQRNAYSNFGFGMQYFISYQLKF